MGKLTDAGVRSSKLAAGMHGDGDGLWLSVTAAGSKSWRYRWKRDGRGREMGLGAYPEISLAMAREMAFEARRLVAAGGDPIEQRRQAREAEAQTQALPTFAEAAKEYIDGKEAGWRNEKHRQQWRNTLTTYCATFSTKPVDEVSTEHVLEALRPVWTVKAETASRVRGRIEAVLDFAKVMGWREGENPARWRGHLQALLPARQKLQRGHHAALAYSDVPVFMVDLRSRPALAARCLEFAILTAARSGEARGATWNEIDLDAGTWAIPAGRMKAGKPHTVPLSDRALAIVKKLSEARVSDYVFPGQRAGAPLSVMALDMLLRRTGQNGVTVHGFRSSFRDWCGNETAFAREVAEAALAHQTGDATERAYRRSDALAKRRLLMQAWDDYCATAPGADFWD